MYFRVKRTGAYAYLQIVESFREASQVRQRVLTTVFQGKRFVLRSQVLGHAHKAFMAAGVALPPTLREKV